MLKTCPVDEYCQTYQVQINMTIMDVLQCFEANLDDLLDNLAAVQPEITSLNYFIALVASLASQFRSRCRTGNWAELLHAKLKTKITKSINTINTINVYQSSAKLQHCYAMMQQAALRDVHSHFLADLMVWCCMPEAFSALMIHCVRRRAGYDTIVAYCAGLAKLAASFCLSITLQPISFKTMMHIIQTNQTSQTKRTASMYVRLDTYTIVLHTNQPNQPCQPHQPGQLVTKSKLAIQPANCVSCLHESQTNQTNQSHQTNPTNQPRCGKPDQSDRCDILPGIVVTASFDDLVVVHTKSFVYVLDFNVPDVSDVPDVPDVSDVPPKLATISASFSKTAACIAYPVYQVEMDSLVTTPPVMSVTDDLDYLIVDLYAKPDHHRLLSSVLISGITPVMCLPHKIRACGQSVVYFSWKGHMYFLDLNLDSGVPVLGRNAMDSACFGLPKINIERGMPPLIQNLMVACPLDTLAVSALPNCIVAITPCSLVVYQLHQTDQQIKHIPTQIVNLCHACTDSAAWQTNQHSIFVESGQEVTEYNFERLDSVADMTDMASVSVVSVVHHKAPHMSDLTSLSGWEPNLCCLTTLTL